MGQISIPAANKSGYSMFWNSMWDSKHNYNVFLKQDIFIKSSLILFLNDYSSDKLFFFLKLDSRKNFNKYLIVDLKFKKNINFNSYYNFIRNSENNNDLFFSKLWLLRYQSWVILNISILSFFKNNKLKKNIDISFDNWFFVYYKNLLQHSLNLNKKFFFNFIFLFYRYLLNNKLIDLDEKLNIFLLNNKGFNKKMLSKIEERIENDSNIIIKELNKNEWEHFLKISYSVIPFGSSFIKKKILNIAFLDLLTTYRGWRHVKGLPVRGQRTWTNAWSVYKSNNTLRNFKVKMAKKFYGNVPLKEANIAYSAEYVNLLWRVQWEQEWILAKNNRLKFSGHKNTMKIDLYSMANYQVMHPLKLKNLSKKQKQSFKKNYFSLGFDPGFTKILIKTMFHSNDSGSESDLSGSSLVLRDERLNRKKKR